MKNDVVVSVCCTAYNHEKYIAQAIESMVLQNTDFKYEILIHDDASSDNTQAIIKKFSDRYPDTIKPVYQKENQYSQGISVGQMTRERAVGKYIAMCEGDDYWTDKYKLQKQVEFLERNPECSLCTHATYIIDAKSDKKIGRVRPLKGDGFVSTEQVIRGGGGIFATNSIMYPARYIHNRPDFFNSTTVGDLPLFAYLALNGSVYYFDRYMSAYRQGVVGSWTKRNLVDRNATIEHFSDMMRLLEEINEYSNRQYSGDFDWAKKSYEFAVLEMGGRKNVIRSNAFKTLYGQQNTKNKVALQIRYRWPRLFEFLMGLKKTF